MARKGAHLNSDRDIGKGAEFLKEEPRRARLDSGNRVMPRPGFVQPDTGTHSAGVGGADRIGIGYDPTKQRIKSGNVETDIRGGLY